MAYLKISIYQNVMHSARCSHLFYISTLLSMSWGPGTKLEIKWVKEEHKTEHNEMHINYIITNWQIIAKNYTIRGNICHYAWIPMTSWLGLCSVSLEDLVVVSIFRLLQSCWYFCKLWSYRRIIYAGVLYIYTERWLSGVNKKHSVAALWNVW